MDNLVFDEAVNSTIEQSEFISKKWIYVNDNNSQNYTSQVVLDSTPLSNAGGWINWSEGYILMPLVVQLTSTDAASLPVDTPRADYAWAFKNGFWNMINSMNVEFNNQNIIQQTPLSNVFRSFKAHTSFSTDDLLNEGTSIGYCPDTAGSWTYRRADSADGRGLCNNKNNSAFVSRSSVNGGTIAANKVLAYPDTGVAGIFLGANGAAQSYSGTSNPSGIRGNHYGHNAGMLERQSAACYAPFSDVATESSTQNLINDKDTCRTVYRSSRVSSVAGSVVWNVFAKLRLKDLSEYFEKCPLLKGSTIRFYINTNQVDMTFTNTVATFTTPEGVATSGTVIVNSVNVIGGQSNPLMICSNTLGSGLSALVADTYKLSCSIVKNSFTPFRDAGQTTPLTACRLYAPVYQFNSLAQQRYLQLAPTKKIVYRDIFQYQFTGIAAQSDFNFLVSNGIPRIQSVLVVPFIPAGSNGATAPAATDGLAYSTLLSPFSTMPASPDPITLTNFNIMISGVNLFLNNQLYDFEQFRHELMSSNQLNGNLTTGLTSGLISEDMFSRGYRYYYGNCSRILPAEANVSRSVQLIGKNASLIPCNLLVFVEFEREMTIDIATGARIE